MADKDEELHGTKWLEAEYETMGWDKSLLTLEEIISILKEANMSYKPSREHYLVLDSDIELKALLKAQLAEAQKGEQRIRELLWATHPCEGKYYDDGELQCGRFLPPIDFKHDSWEVIAQGIEEHTKQRIEEALKPLDSPKLREEIEELAKQEIHPYAKEPVTSYEIHAVRRFVSFGLRLLALIPDGKEMRKQLKDDVWLVVELRNKLAQKDVEIEEAKRGEREGNDGKE